jgi:shikimate kinase
MADYGISLVSTSALAHIDIAAQRCLEANPPGAAASGTAGEGPASIFLTFACHTAYGLASCWPMKKVTAGFLGTLITKAQF